MVKGFFILCYCLLTIVKENHPKIEGRRQIER